MLENKPIAPREMSAGLTISFKLYIKVPNIMKLVLTVKKPGKEILFFMVLV